MEHLWTMIAFITAQWASSWPLTYFTADVYFFQWAVRSSGPHTVAIVERLLVRKRACNEWEARSKESFPFSLHLLNYRPCTPSLFSPFSLPAWMRLLSIAAVRVPYIGLRVSTTVKSAFLWFVSSSVTVSMWTHRIEPVRHHSIGPSIGSDRKLSTN